MVWRMIWKPDLSEEIPIFSVDFSAVSVRIKYNYSMIKSCDGESSAISALQRSRMR